jgi:transcriptional regulator with XRE-family HTH domain
MTFGERLKELRERAGLTQSAAAEAAGVGLPTLKDYEGNRRVPSLENAQSLARALGVSCQAFEGCEFRHAQQRQAQRVTSPGKSPARPARASSKGKAGEGSTGKAKRIRGKGKEG